MPPSGSEPDDPAGGPETWLATHGPSPDSDQGTPRPKTGETLAPDGESGPVELRTHETWTDGNGARPADEATRPEAGTAAFIGPYRILGTLGEGGMGVVYKAEQRSPRRLVAVKVIRNTVATRAMRRRFEFEAQVLARLDHPGIARIYECVADGPQSWFAMEYVEGRCLDDFIDEERLSTPQILDLLARVCDAVHHAHLRGIIHRDLKPGNILITDEGQPKVLDFGIARAVESDGEQDPARHTRAGQIVGTPAYMSPEQASIEGSDIDARSDVYALGVIAYQALCGSLPLEFEGLPLPALLRTIAEVEPKRLARRDRRFRGDIDQIVHKAMEKSRDQRYQSASALADDLRRTLNDEPVHARPTTATYALWKLVRRNKLLSAGVGGWVLTVFVAALVLAVLLAQTAALYRQSQASADALAARNDALVQLQARAELRRDPTRTLAWLKTLDPAVDRPELYGLVHEAEVAGVAADLLLGHSNEVRFAAIGNDGRAATASYDGIVRAWFGTDRTTLSHTGHGGGQAKWVGYHPLSNKVVSLGEDGSAQLLDGRSRPLIQVDGGLEIGAFSSDGHLAVGGDGGTIAVLDPAGEEVARFAIDGALEAMVFPGPLVAVDRTGSLWSWTPKEGPLRIGTHPDRAAGIDAAADGQIATCGYGGEVRIWHEGTSTLAHTHGHECRGVIWVDGSLVSADRGGEVKVYEPSTGQLLAWQAHNGVVRSLAAGSDGRFATGGADGVVRLWTVDGLSHTLLGHTQRVRQVSFSPDGRWLISASTDGTARVWQVPEARGALPEAAALRTDVAWSAAGELAWVDSVGGVQRLVDGVPRRWVAHADESESLAWGDTVLVTGSRDHTVKIWRGREIVRDLMWTERIDQVALTSDASWVAAAGRDPDVPLWSSDDDTPRRLSHQGRIKQVSISPDDRWLAAAGEDRAVTLWTLTPEVAKHATYDAFDQEVLVVAWSSTGIVAAGDNGGAVAFLRPDPDAGPDDDPWALAERWADATGPVLSLAWSPDGSRVAVGSSDGGIRIYQPGNPVPADTLDTGAPVLALAWGSTLWSGADDGTVSRWDLRTGTARPLTGPQAPIRRLSISPDGSRIAAAADGREWVWPTTLPEPSAVRDRMQELTRASLGAGDELEAKWVLQQ